MEVTRNGNIINIGRYPFIASFTPKAARELGEKLIAASTPAVRTYGPYKWITDDGHGWLEVPIQHVRDAGVLDQVSKFSYLRHGEQLGTLYLEEDCDAPLFLRAVDLMEEARTYKDLHTDGDSRVRTLPHWKGAD